MPPGNTATSHTAIIVDNDKDYRKTLASIIKTHFKIREVYTCSTGREAMGVCRQLKNIDFIFCDSDITDEPALKLIQKIKKEKDSEELNIILLSTNAKREFLLEAASIGVNAFILKPFTSKTVTEKIRQLINGKSQRSTKRIKLFNTATAHIAFANAKYKGELEDISSGGCMINMPTLSNGGTIYDQTAIRIIYENESVDLKAELIRLERDNSSDDKNIKAAFIFKDMDDETTTRFKHLWEVLDKSKKESDRDPKSDA